MSSRRATKLLMSIGIQRNDARVFVKVYHTVKAAGMTRFFHEMEVPISPPIRETAVIPYRLRAKRTIPRWQLENGLVDNERRIKDELAKEIGRGLVNAGAIRITRRDELFGAEFCAEVKVLPPDEG